MRATRTASILGWAMIGVSVLLALGAFVVVREARPHPEIEEDPLGRDTRYPQTRCDAVDGCRDGR